LREHKMAFCFAGMATGTTTMDYKTWCSLSDEELGSRDIAEVNLAAAFGLPEATSLDISALCEKLDHWAALIARGTQNALRHRAQHHTDLDLSDAQFRMLVLITVLQRNLGVQYNVAFSEGTYDASDSRNLFLHGLLSGHGGTCVTMPVLYVAIGRRLGYPLKLVLAREHAFCRWDDPHGERFNIEATSPGLNLRNDEHYHTWPKPISAEEIRRGWYLRNLSPGEELAFFLSLSGDCCIDNLQTYRAVEAFYYAHQLVPDFPGYHTKWGIAIILCRAMDELRRQSKENPLLTELRMPLPKQDWERDLYPLAQEALVRILRNRRTRHETAASQESPRLPEQRHPNEISIGGAQNENAYASHCG
jgi:hypothetical protein